jgi:hypothetical protein
MLPWNAKSGHENFYFNPLVFQIRNQRQCPETASDFAQTESGVPEPLARIGTQRAGDVAQI